MGASRSLSLDHITVADVAPWQLVELAAETGCAGICPFLHSMAVLPAMPEFDLVRDRAALRKTCDALAATGVKVSLVYPVTLTGRTVVSDFVPLMDTAAQLSAPLVNVLCYDRDPARRAEKLAELAGLAAEFQIGLSIEFYPPSQLRTLGDALVEIERTGRDDIGVTVDLLHVMRGNDAAAAMGMLSDKRIRFAQIADGPAEIDDAHLEWEAGMERMLPGEGVFGISDFLSRLDPCVPVSIEAPQQCAIEAGATPLERARRAAGAAMPYVQARLAA